MPRTYSEADKSGEALWRCAEALRGRIPVVRGVRDSGLALQKAERFCGEPMLRDT